MYKRPANKNAFQYKEPKTKMRKLDVSLCGTSNSSDTPKAISTLQMLRPSTSKGVTDDKENARSSSAYSNNKPQIVNVPPNNDEMWADADDELILIASQVVDNMDVIGQQIIVQSMELSQNNVAERNTNNGADKFLKDFLQSTEEEDRIFSELINFDTVGKDKDMNEYLNDNQNTLVNQITPQINSSQRPISPTVFKVPMTIPYNRPVNGTVAIPSSTQNDPNFTFRPEDLPQSTQFSQRIEIPKPVEQIGNLNLR